MAFDANMTFAPNRLVIKPVSVFGAHEAAEGPGMFEGIARVRREASV